VLFTDEVGFTRNGILNCHNRHIWCDVNPHNTVQSRHQQQFSVNVWAGIAGEYFVGPHALSHRLNGAAYLHLLEHILTVIGYCPAGYSTKCEVHARWCPQLISITPPEITLTLPTLGDG
jgi:hypothetical protein